MMDITPKLRTFREATARARVEMDPETLRAIREGRVPKGDVLEISRSVAFHAAKFTPHLLPFTHPVDLTHVAVDYAFEDRALVIRVTCRGLDRTGFEVEAMHAAAVAALNVYDMIKPLDATARIAEVVLEDKRGGKSTFQDRPPEGMRAAVLVVSDSVAAGKKEDRAGKTIRRRLEELGVSEIAYAVVPDEPDLIREKVEAWIREGRELVITTGGTGLSPRDRTPEALRGLLEREIPGVAVASLVYGLERTPYAMLSRTLCGITGNTVILALPGSSRGAQETMDALFPHLFHLYRVLKGARHD